MRISKEFKSSDGTIKRLHELDDGKFVESVLIPHKTKVSQCISTQVGCKMKCTFCESGKSFTRNLTADEIVNQVDSSTDSIVFMGMGEPLDNPNLISAIERIKLEKKIPSRKIAVSTSGLLDKVDLLLPTKVNIAFSVHAATDEKRNKIMPINRKYPIAELKKKMHEIASKIPSKRRIEIQYILIKGFNDSIDDAKELVKIAPPKTLINLIPYNATSAGFSRPDESVIQAFKSEMRKNGFICYVRETRGEDINAACGMLAGKENHLKSDKE